MKLVHGSLFSGIGGFDLASQWRGWTNAFNCEINPFCRQVLQYHFKDSISYEDIRQTDFTEWRGKIDVLTGGFPCQPFSVAGLRKGKDDDRYLWPEMLRVIREINPTWIVGENVAGITSMVQPGKIAEMGGQSTIFGKNTRRICRQEYVIETICKDLEKEGYSVQTFIIPACSVGAPHRRDRVWFVSRREEKMGLSYPDTDGDKCNTPEKSKRVNEQGRNISQQVKRREEAKFNNRLSDFQQPDRYSDFINLERDSESGKVEKERWKDTNKGHEKPSSYNGDFWNGFPAFSPVCSRNDGLPFNVDSLTVSFNKWREESLKAYGNAIVPQVAYEIFKAIEKDYERYSTR